MNPIELSIVVLAWDQLPMTQACVNSLRSNTDVSYELIIVDNGSGPEAVEYAKTAADIAVLNGQNLGFAAGMNQGLNRASGRYVAFVNNDTSFPTGWSSQLLSNFERRQTGLVAPAVTAAGNPVTVRSAPGDRSLTLTRFGELPSGVVYVMPTALMHELGGWNELYPVASAEDLDLIFTVWTNDLDIILDERVLVQHVSRGTVKAKLPNREQLYRDNLKRFLDRWSGTDEIVQIADCDSAIHARNRAAGRSAAIWLGRLIEEREKSRQLRSQLQTSETPETPRKRRFGR